MYSGLINRALSSFSYITVFGNSLTYLSENYKFNWEEEKIIHPDKTYINAN